MKIHRSGASNADELSVAIKYASLSGVDLSIEETDKTYNLPKGIFDGIKNFSIYGTDITLSLHQDDFTRLKSNNISLVGISKVSRQL